MQSLLVLGSSECNSKCCGVSSHASSALSCLCPRGSDTPLENLVPDMRGNYGYVPPGLDLVVCPTRFVQTWSSGNSHTTTIRQQSAEIYLKVMLLAWAWEKKWKHGWTGKKRKRRKEEANKEWTCCEAFCAHFWQGIWLCKWSENKWNCTFFLWNTNTNTEHMDKYVRVFFYSYMQVLVI